MIYKHRIISDFFGVECFCKVSEPDWCRSQFKNFGLETKSKISHSAPLYYVERTVVQYSATQ